MTTSATQPTTDAVVCQNIRAAMLARNLSEQDLATAADVPCLDDCLAGRRSFYINEVAQIANALGLPAAELFQSSS